ncbi:MAG: NYN domain-containing protein [Clostridia bacterium]|nr:NYN domain-containing protein [Clostridia bacterium]
MEDKKFALLIDADNTSSKYIKTIVDEITNLGITTYRRIYGDWTSPNLQNWKETLLEYSITPMQQYGYTTGKNSTDSAMIIDAMDILYAGNVDGFCLVSSDSDFTKLAMRLREAGKTVIGMGKKQTPRPFVTACNQFKYLDLLSKEGKEEKAAVKQTTKKAKDTGRNSDDKKLVASICKIIEENSNDDGWMYAARVGKLLSKKYPDFDSRNYGYKKFALLLEGLGFETRKEPGVEDKNACEVYVKIKE